MRSSSSTSSSSPKRILAVAAGVLLFTSLIAWAVSRLAPDIAEKTVLFCERKLEWSKAGLADDIVILGDSQATASLRPNSLAPLVGPGLEIRNYGLPGASPAGLEPILANLLNQPKLPRLVVLAFVPQALQEDSARFQGLVLPNLMDAKLTLRTALETDHPDYLVQWAALRLPTYRLRESILQTTLGWVARQSPRFASLLLDATGLPLGARRARYFEWEYGDREARNETILRELEAERGWRYFREWAFAGEKLPPNHLFDYGPFAIDTREVLALRHIVARCRAANVPILVLPLPVPEGRVRELEAKNGIKPFQALWRKLGAGYRQLYVSQEALIPTVHDHFSDNAHLNLVGLHDYTPVAANLIKQALGTGKESGRRPAAP